ncbi:MULTISPECIES: hypothetical protein [Chryseobacterium]|uniref:Parallel beta helix pectate lyase-like protein n=1 Tax=Chryseobacterium geocarposphaerae TaxID=1416776 RepID=A0ABU1LIK1_9FLAO|nr:MULTISPECIES: hypothetical protein [Chryseobacterium]MDR6406544.1 hypothetical protein [Chryseobacterium geocarposphaerae]MDR6699957.1 hypothetical protein [Chryseobacterium ginsenosidimutans]
MKKNHLKLIAAALFIGTSFAIQSCSNSDDDSIPTVSPVGIAQDPNNFKGDVPSGQVVTLDPSKVYKLTGAVMVKDGGKLVIPAGTRIEATGGTSSFITIEQGGQIFANGTASAPVIFTSPAGAPGSWGGLVLCGRAPINKGTSATAEVGNATYGGTNATDNSGSLTYVRVEYAGAIYTADKEFNGLSLFGVGNGTKVENVALVNGSDDGIEFFGGTVNVSNIVSISNEDDGFDWTEGWNGTATNVYTKRRANGTGNRGIEADNNSNNHDASPRSNPTIKNATFIGATSGEADGIKLRVGTYATIDNVVLSGWSTGINMENDATVSYFNGGGKITNVKFDNITTKASAKSNAGTSVTVLAATYTENTNAAGAGNGTATPTWASGWSSL